MSSVYAQLLDATIHHLERLKADGAEFVPVRASTLAALASPLKPATTTRRTSAPTTPAATNSAAPGSRPVSRPTSAPAAAPAPLPMSVPLGVLPIADEAPAPTGRPAVMAIASDLAKPLPPPLDPAAKTAGLQALRERVLACTKCDHLVKSRKTVVFGVGDIHARLLFVGEAPGAEEDVQGEPFVGAAGQKLTQIIQAMGLTRAKVFIANVLKCRPDTPGQAYGNRKPRPDEMATCLPYLQEQIELMQPEAIVALGATAMEGLFGENQVFITKARGRWRSFRGIPVMPTYHPSYILRNEALTVKRQVWEDMLAVMERLGMPINEKQRNYFLPGKS